MLSPTHRRAIKEESKVANRDWVDHQTLLDRVYPCFVHTCTYSCYIRVLIVPTHPQARLELNTRFNQSVYNRVYRIGTVCTTVFFVRQALIATVDMGKGILPGTAKLETTPLCIVFNLNTDWSFKIILLIYGQSIRFIKNLKMQMLCK